LVVTFLFNAGFISYALLCEIKFIETYSQLTYSQLTTPNLTDFAAPNRLVYLALLAAPQNPNLREAIKTKKVITWVIFHS